MSKSTNFTKRFVLATALLGLMIGATGRTEALQIINIDDRTDTPSATVNGVPVTLLPNSSGEFIHFIYQLENNAADPFQLTLSSDLLEPGTGALSDRLFITHTLGSQFVDVQFDSRDSVLLPVGQFNGGSRFEDGSFQNMGLDYSFASFGNADGRFFVASDVVEISTVPEPSTILLVLTGFAALVSIQIRRRVGQRLEFPEN